MKNSNLHKNVGKKKKKKLEALSIHLMIRKRKTTYTRTLDSLERREKKMKKYM